MNRLSSVRDVTHKQPGPGVGHGSTALLFAAPDCQHKGQRVGAEFRGKVPWLCAACKARKVAA